MIRIVREQIPEQYANYIVQVKERFTWHKVSEFPTIELAYTEVRDLETIISSKFKPTIKNDYSEETSH